MSVKMYDGCDNQFREACKRAEILPTRRQYKKWCERRGTAWTKGREPQ